MRVLVTGSAGFIGSKLSKVLCSRGHDVIGLDNVSNAYDISLKEWRLSELRLVPRFTFFRLDIGDLEALDGLFDTYHIDVVANLAARAGVRESLKDPIGYFQTNVLGTINLLELCRKHQINKFVLASTSSVYAGNKPPFQEDKPTDQPASPYSASKKAAELVCHAYWRLFGIETSILRYFTVYGPAGRPDMSIFRFVRWMAEGEPLILYGDGSQERDFTYLDDIAEGTVLAIERNTGFNLINLGSDRPVPLTTVITQLEDILQRKAILNYHPVHPSDILVTRADIDKARKLLGWEPKTSLEAGLRSTVRWYLENRQWAANVDLRL